MQVQYQYQPVSQCGLAGEQRYTHFWRGRAAANAQRNAAG